MFVLVRMQLVGPCDTTISNKVYASISQELRARKIISREIKEESNKKNYAKDMARGKGEKIPHKIFYGCSLFVVRC